MVDKLDIFAEAVGSKPVNVTIEIDLVLSSQVKNISAPGLVKNAVGEAYEAIENYLGKLK